VTSRPLPRAGLLAQLQQDGVWDLAVVGGGATGLGVALDATVRGFRVLLVDSHDFAQGTSSRATKLAHGGVRYLAQGDIGLVHEALQERGAMLANAPHVAQRLAFVMPGYKWWESGFYGVGLKAYDVLAGRRGLGATEFLNARQVRELLPTVRQRGLAGGVKYWDGQFDDARLAMGLARTAAARGAVIVNHMAVTGLLREGGQVHGLTLQDRTPGNTTPPLTVRARCVVNAAGVWVDAVRDMDREADAPPRPAMVAPSQGVHLVVDRRFLPGHHALLVPKTEDGRVLFAVPWLGKTILGTTDTPRDDLARDPLPFHDEVEFILREAGRYLDGAPRRADVRSVWVGLRPLVKPTADEGPGGDGDRGASAAGTKAISREHTVIVGRSGLVTVTGGKWTTYRAMAEDVLDRAMARGLLERRPGGVTERLPLVGAAPGRPLTEPPGEHLYGSEAALLRSLPGAEHWLWRDAESGQGGLSEAMVRFAARYEMAQSVEDVLARRCRLLFLDAAEAARQAEAVASILAEELGAGFDATASAAAFRQLAAQYQQLP
jgi:glycerol-3-phosphate dehydrogenase